MENRLPNSILENKVIERYVEPFVGGGALFFHLQNNYQVKKSILLDVNMELIMAYKTIQNDFKYLISILKDMEDEHLKKSEKDRKKNYYSKRDDFNTQMHEIDYTHYSSDWVDRAAHLIF